MLRYYINLLIKFNIIKHLTISFRAILTSSSIIQCLFYIAHIFMYSRIVREELRLSIPVAKMLNTTFRDV